MTFSEYQQSSEITITPKVANDYMLLTIGLCGEAGEVAEKIKKVRWHSNGIMTDADKDLLVKELGDVLWYVTQLAAYAGTSLDKVASVNLAKLSKRASSGILKGYGDNR